MCGFPAPLDAPTCIRCGHGYVTQFNQTQMIPAASNRDNWAIASLALGILAWMNFLPWSVQIPCGILAVIFGILSLKSNQKGIAIAGLVCGIASVLFTVFIFAWASWVVTTYTNQKRIDAAKAPPAQPAPASSTSQATSTGEATGGDFNPLPPDGQ